MRGILKLLILKELEKSEATGYELIKRLGRFKRPSTGSVYPVLKELADAGFLNVRSEGRKKVYSLSDKGKLVLREAVRREKEAILRKMEVLKSSGIIGDREVEEMLRFIESKRKQWIRLYELENWSRFLEVLSRAVERSKTEAERVIEEAIRKLERIR